ncbi:MAG: biofilm PGA synthesis N-glycosyltransferase PgaC [Polaribacter sp.]|jgi:biofilm PGA synthesis N-glycosyltransferase PgaC
MLIVQWLFFICLFLVFYTYLGYGIVLFFIIQINRLINGKKPNPTILPDAELPEVTFVVAAFNEREYMVEKIKNGLDFDYPKDKIKYLWVTDGSDDDTPDVIRNYNWPKEARYEVYHESARKGKIAAVERIMHFVDSPIVIFTDANTFVNPMAIKNIVRHYQDPKVGAVAGEKRILMEKEDAANAAGEGIYWKYESTLKRWDSELHSVVGAAGELFSLRTELFEAVSPDTIIEDFYMTLRIAQKGYQVVYEPTAYAAENSSASVKEELKRKIRIAAGGLQAISRLTPLLNFFKYGTLSFQYISHRVLRWTLAPLALLIILITNITLAFQGDFFFQIVMALQILFYAMAAIGYLLERKAIKFKAFFVPYYFCVMNYAVYRGFFRIIKGKQSVLWERAERKKAETIL